MELKPGQTWRHYKGGIYKIIALGRNSETDDLYDVVIYENTAEPKIWVQSVQRFLSTEEREGKIVPRFELITNA